MQPRIRTARERSEVKESLQAFCTTQALCSKITQKVKEVLKNAFLDPHFLLFCLTLCQVACLVFKQPLHWRIHSLVFPMTRFQAGAPLLDEASLPSQHSAEQT